MPQPPRPPHPRPRRLTRAPLLRCSRRRLAGPAAGLLCLGAALATAAPPATSAADIDGDGRPEQIELGADLVVRRGAQAGGAAAGAAARPAVGEVIGRLPLGGMREARREEAPPPYVVVRGTRAGGAALLVAALRGGKLEEVYSGPVGPAGRDGEYSIDVKVGAEVLRAQSAPGVTRCDGEGRLFPERYRPGAGWEPAPAPIPAGRRLSARGAPPAGLSRDPLPIYRVVAASAQAGVERADLLSPPRELEDGRPETAWRLPGDGRGAWITLRASGPGHSVRALRIQAAAGPGAPRAPRTLAAIFADGKAFHFDLPPGGPAWIELPEPQRSPCVSLAIVSGSGAGPGSSAAGPGSAGSGAGAGGAGGGSSAAGPGSAGSGAGAGGAGGGSSAAGPGSAGSGTGGAGLGEVAAYSELDGQGPAALARLAAGADMQIGEGAARALGQLGPAEAPAVLTAVGEALPGAQASGRRRLGALVVELLRGADEAGRARLGPRAAPILRQLTATAPSEERAPLLGAFAALPEAPAALQGLAADAALPAELRTEALARLGARGGEAAVAALLSLSEGAREAPVRRGIVAGLAAALRCRPAADPVLGAARDGLLALARRRPVVPEALAAIADVAEALGRAGGGCDKEGAAPIATLVEAYRALGAEDAFPARLRLLQALAALGPAAEAAAPLLREVLGGAEEPVLRAVAARAAAALPGDGALALRGLADGDAGVRIAALGALAGRSDAQALAEVERILGADRWPQARRAAAEARAAACAPGSGAVPALRRALKDEDDEVQRRALAAVVRCEGAGAAKLLGEIARDAARGPGLRGQACGLLGRQQGAAAAPTLAAVMTQVLREAGEDDRQTALAVSCMRALSRAAGAAAAAPIIDILGDNAALDAAAYQELGALCRGGLPAPQRARLGAQVTAARKSPDPRLQSAAAAAARRCGLGN